MGETDPAGDAFRADFNRRDFLGVAGAFTGLGLTRRLGTPALLAPEIDIGVATVLGIDLLVGVKATAPADIQLQAWPMARPDLVTSSAWQRTSTADTTKFVLRGAAPAATAVGWQTLVRPPGATTAPVADIVRTVPARPAPGSSSSFTFAFGSCTLKSPAFPSLRVAKSHNPLFFAMLGDLVYVDGSYYVQSYDTYARAFRDVLADRDSCPITDAMPWYGMQDDHDYGKDDCHAETVAAHAVQAFADLIPGASRVGPSYRRWSVGEADFFLLDNRRYRDGPPPYENGLWPSTLGTVQREWLFAGLRTSSAPVKFVFVPMTFTWYWGRREKDTVLAFINANVTGKVIFLTGDKHAAGFACHLNGKAWEFLAGPLSNPKKHLTPQLPGVIWTENGTGRALSNGVGLVTVDTATTRTVTMQFLKETGLELHRETVTL